MLGRVDRVASVREDARVTERGNVERIDRWAECQLADGGRDCETAKVQYCSWRFCKLS